MKIGVDLTKIERFKNNDRLAKKILNDLEFNEYLSSINKDEYLASRFALKEAFLKSIEKGILEINLKDILVNKKDSGAISIIYQNKEYSASLSHEEEYCVGVVLND